MKKLTQFSFQSPYSCFFSTFSDTYTTQVQVKCTHHMTQREINKFFVFAYICLSLWPRLYLCFSSSPSIYLLRWPKTHLALRGRETAWSRLKRLLVFRSFYLTLPLYTTSPCPFFLQHTSSSGFLVLQEFLPFIFI